MTNKEIKALFDKHKDQTSFYITDKGVVFFGTAKNLAYKYGSTEKQEVKEYKRIDFVKDAIITTDSKSNDNDISKLIATNPVSDKAKVTKSRNTTKKNN